MGEVIEDLEAVVVPARDGEPGPVRPGRQLPEPRDPVLVADYGPEKVNALLQDAGIVRHPFQRHGIQ